MIVLDTNVISELGRDHATSAVAEWLDGQLLDDLFTTSVTIAELTLGVALLPSGARRAAHAEALDRVLDEVFPGRILPFDQVAAAHYGDLQARRIARGRPVDPFDVQIAAIARAHSAPVATRNVRHFDHDGLHVVNPWEGPAGTDWG